MYQRKLHSPCELNTPWVGLLFSALVWHWKNIHSFLCFIPKFWIMFLNNWCYYYSARYCLLSVYFHVSSLHRIVYFTKMHERASLVAQWLRIRLPMQGTWVQALVREDPTCRRATKSVCHNYWACALEPASHNYWAHAPPLLKPARLEPVLCNKRSHRN